jgi:hypothetical protein
MVGMDGWKSDLKKVEKLKVINLIAGPGAGKSTTAAGVFYKLKSMDINCELVTEYAKEKVWDNHLSILDDQLYLISHQFHKLFRLVGQVEVAITDAPFPLSWYYNNKELSQGKMGACMDDLIQCCYDWFDNYNYFVVREKKFNPKGRIHNEIESKEIDAAMRKILAAKNIPYKQIIGKDKAVDFVVSDYLQQRKI